jgi:hypothetical protein
MRCGKTRTLDSMTTIAEPPILLDSARVVMYAETGGSASYTGRITVHAGGHWLEPVPRLAICEDLVDGDILIFHCDESWNVLAAGRAKSVEDAQRTAESAYSGITSKWVPYRALSANEVAELEAGREELRLLAKQLPQPKGWLACCLTARW